MFMRRSGKNQNEIYEPPFDMRVKPQPSVKEEECKNASSAVSLGERTKAQNDDTVVAKNIATEPRDSNQ